MLNLKPSSPCSHACFTYSACVMAVAAAITTTKAQFHDPEQFLVFLGIMIIWTPKASSHTYETIFQNCAIFLRTDAHWFHEIKLFPLRMLILGQKPCPPSLKFHNRDQTFHCVVLWL